MSTRSNARNAIAAGFLGWTFDAFDFFVLVFVLPDVAKEFGRSIPALALTTTATLATRPVGAFIFGLLADRYGRRPILMANITFYSLMEVLSGLAPGYASFLALRLLYGVGMGATGAWEHRWFWNRCRRNGAARLPDFCSRATRSATFWPRARSIRCFRAGDGGPCSSSA